MKEANNFIIKLYFAVISAVTILTLMFGTIELINIGLKTWIFTAADAPSYVENCTENQYIPVKGDDQIVDSSTQYIDNCEARNKQNEENYAREKAQDIVNDLAMIIVTFPLFLLHFKFVFEDWKQSNKKKEKLEK